MSNKSNKRISCLKRNGADSTNKNPQQKNTNTEKMKTPVIGLWCFGSKKNKGHNWLQLQRFEEKFSDFFIANAAGSQSLVRPSGVQTVDVRVSGLARESQLSFRWGWHVDG